MSAELPPIDKSAWGEGPWQDEPDFERGEHEGFPFIVLRNPRSGNFCGYVAVPPGHPWHGKSYTTPDFSEPEVHGGITYGDVCNERVCHVPKPGESDAVWWLGFDCNHSGDFAPGQEATLSRIMPRTESWPRDVYRRIGYVREQCKHLAEQAKAAGG